MIVALAALYAYLRRALGRLGTAVGVLNALAQGDTTVHVDAGQQRDEVGRIGAAVGRLRKELLAFARLRRAREKQRDRQEQFIRREMVGLAATLDPAARHEVLDELEEIDTQLAAQRQTTVGILDTQGAEGLSLMALAFEKMAARIRDQQGRMGELIAELRTALETRTAYLALQQELEIAQRVQLASLPEALPPTPDLELVGRMLPAREVGGDCYDYFRARRRAYRDRRGRRVRQGRARGVVHGHRPHLAARPGAAFRRPRPLPDAAQRAAVAEQPRGTFVTVFYGIFDRRTGRLVYANGGHNQPLLLRDDRIEILPRTGGMALAALDGVTYAERSVEIRPGDTILFFTDGITEAMAPGGEEYGIDRLIALLAGCHALPAPALLDLVLDDIRSFAGSEPQADDITCVALCYHGAVPDAGVAPQGNEGRWIAASGAMMAS